MSQNFRQLLGSGIISEDREAINENFDAVRSCHSGTTAPTDNLISGMMWFDTSTSKLYQLKTNLTTWMQLADLSGSVVVVPNASNADTAEKDGNGNAISGYVANIEQDTSGDAFVLNIYDGNNNLVGSARIDVMQGASSGEAGQAGLVPPPTSNDAQNVLHGDGTWKKAVGFESYWEAQETVQVGEIRFPTGRVNSGIVLECVEAGTTGVEQPEIPDVVGVGLTAQDIQTLLVAIEQVQTTNGQTASKITGISDYIVESYRNGTEWYEVYKSGKVRQGGKTPVVGSSNATVTFLITMADTNYSPFGSLDQSVGGVAMFRFANLTETSMLLVRNGSTNSGGWWVVEGQGA